MRYKKIYPTRQPIESANWKIRARALTPLKIDKCKIIYFPKISDPRGNLSFIEEKRHIPFEIKRAYYLYDVPTGAARGGHAHHKMEAVIIALSGSFEVKIDDGFKRESVLLNRPYCGLYLSPRVWREIENFSSNSIALILASTFYDESDYIRPYKVFKKMVRDGTSKQKEISKCHSTSGT